ncbi:hypothetical protein QBC36DRAFT_295886 [Triangularia setosa]|uniref:Uncharacterized protein n=1 Tax=Triangularia setosa TaxID=2587417 RepID=A0AAN6VWC4_9PEZI|nr:hypothetical protein QBC36DRAFT_295886 [Podospora setosa]
MLSETTISIPWLQKDKVCIRGTGADDFADICAFSCSYGYCPIGACVCLAMGTKRKKPLYTGVVAFPVASRSADYSGLYSFNRNLGKIGDRAAHPTFGPPGWEGLCSYACNCGFCPSNICICTQTRALNVPPPKIRNTVGSSLNPKINDWGRFHNRAVIPGPPTVGVGKVDLSVENSGSRLLSPR